MSAYIRWLVAQKRQWHHPPNADEQTKVFRGWHTRGYLPHFDASGTIQLIGFRLADSLPQERRHEWESILQLKDKREGAFAWKITSIWVTARASSPFRALPKEWKTFSCTTTDAAAGCWPG